METTLTLCTATTDTHFADARVLFEEYGRIPEFAICFDGFSKELGQLRTMYGPPRGTLMLAYSGNEPVGCVALRPFASDASACEMKRLYVRPSTRGSGLGRTLATRIIDEAKSLGYTRMVLDTLPVMEHAQALYRTLGFEETPSHDAVAREVVYMARVL